MQGVVLVQQHQIIKMNIEINESLELSNDGYAVTIGDSFIHALTTKKKSVIGHYEYGTYVYKLKHRPFDSSWIIDFKRCCKDACKWDERLIFNGVTVESNEISTGVISFDLAIGQLILKGSINV